MDAIFSIIVYTRIHFLLNSYIDMRLILRFITFTWTGLINENMFNYKL